MIDPNGVESFTCRGCHQVTQRAEIRGKPYTGAYCSAECLQGSQVREALRTQQRWTVTFALGAATNKLRPVSVKVLGYTRLAAIDEARAYVASTRGVPLESLRLVETLVEGVDQ